MYVYVHKYVYNFLQKKILKFFLILFGQKLKTEYYKRVSDLRVFYTHFWISFLSLITMVRQELPEPNACGHCVRPVNMVYMLTGSSGLKQEARLLVAE
jgi:hypothetical protein